jgi:hypothetical protein
VKTQPTSGKVGASVEILGTDLASSESVTFNGTEATCVYGQCVGGGTIFSLSVGLGPFVETRPTIGRVGSVVRILGTDLTGATSVTFNGTAAALNVHHHGARRYGRGGDSRRHSVEQRPVPRATEKVSRGSAVWDSCRRHPACLCRLPATAMARSCDKNRLPGSRAGPPAAIPLTGESESVQLDRRSPPAVACSEARHLPASREPLRRPAYTCKYMQLVGAALRGYSTWCDLRVL